MAEEEISSKSILLYLLTLSMLGCVNGARSILTTTTGTSTTHGHDHMATTTTTMNANLMVFFTIGDLKAGAKMPIYFPIKNPSTSPHFLPRQEADTIPFSSHDLPYLLDFFSFAPGSSPATAMEETLTHCEGDPIKGETKSCATSLESMLDFVDQTLSGDQGSDGIRVVSTRHLNGRSGVVIQNYTVLGEPKEVEAEKLVSCHTMPYPYAVFYCHSQESENKVFLVELEGVERGDRVEAVAVCHMDTTQWGSGHMSFRVLRVEPGYSGVCHFFPEDNLVYVPAAGGQNRAAA